MDTPRQPDGRDDDEPLPGGYVTSPVRVRDTVRRRVDGQPNPEFGRELLRFFEQRAWAGAPRFLGPDEHGRDVLAYIDGHAAWEPDQPAAVTCPESLAAVGRLVREFHDLTAGTALAAGDEVVCHNDLSPKNTVYRDSGTGLRPVAFIDWDIAAPGERIHDVAHACWQFARLGPDREHEIEEAARDMRAILDGYRLDDRSDVIDAVLWWQDRCWRGIEEKAAAGERAMLRLVESGAAGRVRDAFEWTDERRAQLEAAIR